MKYLVSCCCKIDLINTHALHHDHKILRRIPAHDGLELVAYLTRAVTGAPSPLILLVHGGK